MHFVFIVGSYYPNYSAVGKCAGNIAEELAKNHEVTVICSKNYLHEKKKEFYKNQNIKRVLTKEENNRLKLEKNINDAKGLRVHILDFKLKLFKVGRVIKTLFSKVSVNKDLVQKYLEALSTISEPIDVIIPVCMPIESLIAAVKFKKMYKKKIKLLPYLFDQFAENKLLHRVELNKNIKMKKHIQLEHMLLKESDAILAMHSLRAYFQKKFPDISGIHYLEHPLIVKPSKRYKASNNTIDISYIGSLLKGYVTPDYLLTLYKMTSKENTVLNFYIMGNSDEIVNNYSRQFPHNIINHGSVDKETANNKVDKSNILISIAEKEGKQMSSKIFDYISYGKPIIHFYTVDEDVNLKILNKYPNVLCLKQDKKLLRSNISAFEEFNKNMYNKELEFERVAELYEDATPEYTVNIIKNIIK